MANLLEYLKRHQLIAHFALTYLVTWTLLILFQPLYLEGQRIVAPLLSLGIFAPALVSIGLSAIIEPRRIAADLWRARGYRLGLDIHPSLLDADDPKDRTAWNGG